MYQDPLNQARTAPVPQQNPDNQESLAGPWQDAMDNASERWPLLDAKDVAIARLGRSELIGVLAQRYNYSRQEADRQIESFLNDRPRKGLLARLTQMNGDLAVNQYVSNPAPGPSARDDQPPSILPPDDGKS